MFSVNPPGNRNYALSYRRLSPDSSGSNTRAGQSGQMAAVADNISFSTATVGSMMLHVGKTITTLSEYEKLLLSTVLAPDTEKKPCSALPDNNGIYSWLVDISQYRSSHLLHDAPDQVMVTSALDSSHSCIYRIIISDLSLQHSQLHCDASFDWTENRHPEVSFNVVLPHPAQVSFQQLMSIKEVMMEHSTVRLEELQSPDSVFQCQQSELASHQYFGADGQQVHGPVNGFAATPSFHHVHPDIDNYYIARHEVPSLDHTETDSYHYSTEPTLLSDSVANKPKLSATDEDIDHHIKMMFNKGEISYKEIRESLNRADLGAAASRIKERRNEFYKNNPLPIASDARIIKHINNVSGRGVNAVMQSLHRINLRANKENVTGLLDNWEKENNKKIIRYPDRIRKEGASDDEIIQHIKRIDATEAPSIASVIRSLHKEDIGARESRVSTLLRAYSSQKKDESNGSK